MKISYKVLKHFLQNIKSPDEIARDLVMHTAEVEEIIIQNKNLEKVFVGTVLSCEKHSDSDKLNVCNVRILEETKQIVCGAKNVRAGLKVAVAIVGRELTADFVIQKTKIRGEISEGMICSLDELGLIKDRQEGIWEMPEDSVEGTNLRDYLELNDFILEIDNKAINHRPDMFSYMGVIRELNTINNLKTDIDYKNIDLSTVSKIDTQIKSDFVGRYILTKINGVANIESNDLIKTIIKASGHESKGLLIDLSNYSLYFYGQPTHIFDADKVKGNITVRMGISGEKVVALNDTEYDITQNDIVICDEEKIISIAGIIGAKSSSVDENTKNIYIERAQFDQAVLRFTGKRFGLRTDSLNIFEKDTLKEMCHYGNSLIIDELQNNFKIDIVGNSDFYPNKQEKKTILLDLEFINKLIGINYDKTEVLNILSNLGMILINDTIKVPFWRKDISNIADIAEEIARINGYNKIQSTIPRVNLGAVMQDNIYNLKNDARKYFSSIGYYDVYNYTFVSQSLYQKLNLEIDNCVLLKNSLSEEQTHLRDSLVPNLIKGLSENIRDKSEIKLFEIEKAFFKDENNITEKYLLSGIISDKKDIIYYDLQQEITQFFKKVFSQNFYYDTCKNPPKYANIGRCADIIMGGKKIGIIGEFHPVISKKFDVNNRVGFFEIDIDELSLKSYNLKKAKEISQFQENNFDLSFVVDKEVKGKDILLAIENTDKTYIKKVVVTSYYEDREKFPGKRSITFKIFIQSLTETLSDEFKNNLIKEIISKVEKKGGFLR